jgi:hypothetical protein
MLGRFAAAAEAKLDEKEAKRQLCEMSCAERAHCIGYRTPEEDFWAKMSWSQRLFVARNPKPAEPSPAGTREKTVRFSLPATLPVTSTADYLCCSSLSHLTSRLSSTEIVRFFLPLIAQSSDHE